MDEILEEERKDFCFGLYFLFGGCVGIVRVVGGVFGFGFLFVVVVVEGVFWLRLRVFRGVRVGVVWICVVLLFVGFCFFASF